MWRASPFIATHLQFMLFSGDFQQNFHEQQKEVLAISPIGFEYRHTHKTSYTIYTVIMTTSSLLTLYEQKKNIYI
jgi:hypothetical protein